MNENADSNPASHQDCLLVRAVVLFLLAGIITFGLAVGTSIWDERRPESEQAAASR
jgi:hypothetical protein